MRKRNNFYKSVYDLPGGLTGKISNSSLANMADSTIKGRAAGAGTGVPQDLTAAQVQQIIATRTTFSNANYTILATDKYVAQVGTMTASRTATLPAANSVNPGYEIIIEDESGTVTSTNTIVIARSGSDTIDGATSETISAAYGMRRLFSDGTSKWSFDKGVLRASNNLSDVSSAPTALSNLGVEAAAASVSSASTTNIGAATSENILITGTTTITAFDTVAAGIVRRIRFNGALLLTYNATSLILPTAKNIKTAANDSCFALSLGSGNWYIYNYQRADGGFLPNAINNQTGTTYTLALTDIGNGVTASNASASTYTLPQDSNISFPIGSEIWITNLGAGLVTFVKEGSETLIGNTTCAQYATARIRRLSATQWHVFGGTSTVNMVGISNLIQTVANNTYNLNYYPGCAGTILGVAEKARALTTAGTFKIQIAGVDVTGLTAVVPTTAGSYTTATGANTFTRGQAITITYSGTTAILDHDIVIDWTQQF